MVNQWIQHVKQYAAKHGITYSDALKKSKSSYQSTAKPRKKSMKGKGAFDFLDPNKNGANQFFTRDLPSGLIHQGLPAVGATFRGIAGAELGPVGSLTGAYAGRKAGQMTADKIGELYGYGLYSALKKAGKAALKKQISRYAPAVGRNLARAGADYIGIPGGMAGMAGQYGGQYVANRLNEAIGEGVRRKRRSKGKVLKVKGTGIFEDIQKHYIDPYQPEITAGIDYAKNRFPDQYGPVRNAIRGNVLKGRGNFWNDIQPMTTYLRPAGDALLDKTVEKIKGLGLKKRMHRKKRGGALYAAGYGPPMY
jgi:hypothetical protein